MKCIMNPRPDIQEELIKPYKEMEDVYSLKGSLSSFVFGSTICSSFQYMDAAVKI